MEKKKLFDVKKIVGAGILTAVLVVLQLLSNIIPTGVNLNLSLVPITIGAILYGPLVGGFLGFISGLVVLLSPNTVTVFTAISPFGTIITCLTKTTAAGVLAGFVYRWISKKNQMVATITASAIVPFVNTAMFAIYSYFFFMNGLGLSNIGQIFTVLIGVNFILEIVTNMIISPATFRILKLGGKI